MMYVMYIYSTVQELDLQFLGGNQILLLVISLEQLYSKAKIYQFRKFHKLKKKCEKYKS